MKTATGQREIFNMDGELYGFCFGVGDRAQHKKGFKDIESILGIGAGQGLGIERRSATKYPKEYIHFGQLEIRRKNYAILVLDSIQGDWYKKVTRRMSDVYGLTPRVDYAEFVGKMSDYGFALLASEKYIHSLREIHEAMINKDVAIYDTALDIQKGWDSLPGLYLYIKSRVPENIKARLYEKDLDICNLKKAAEDSGVYELIQSSKFAECILEPAWKDKLKDDVIFNVRSRKYLIDNPLSVEDIKDWVSDGYKFNDARVRAEGEEQKSRMESEELYQGMREMMRNRR